MDRREIPETTECPYYLISRASLAITSRLKREFNAAGVEDVRPSYLGVLVSLWKEDGLKAVELGRRAGLEPSTMTGVLDRMERDGLVVRDPDLDDRRAHCIRLTDQGWSIRDPVMDVVDRTIDAAMEGLAESKIDVLKQILRRVLENTDKAGHR